MRMDNLGHCFEVLHIEKQRDFSVVILMNPAAARFLQTPGNMGVATEFDHQTVPPLRIDFAFPAPQDLQPGIDLVAMATVRINHRIERDFVLIAELFD
jgi:hypothetical protein